MDFNEARLQEATLSLAARWVPHHVSDEQKACRQRIAEELLHRYQTEGRSPLDFDLFPKFKKTLRVKRFATIEEASTELTRVIRQLNSEGVLLGIQDCQNVGKLT